MDTAVTTHDTELSERKKGRFSAPSRWSPLRQTYVFALLLAPAAVALIAIHPDLSTSARSTASWIPVPLVLTIAFGVAVLAVFHVEFRREAISFSLSEVPLVFALVYLTPVTGVAARVIGCAVVLGVIKRPPLFKQLFNVSMWAFETALAFTLVRLIVDQGDASNSVLVFACLAAAVVTGVIASVGVSVAISFFEGGAAERILNEIQASWLFAVNGALATTMLGASFVSPILAIIALIPVVALWLLMLRFGKITQQLRDLDEVHGFAGRVGRSLDLAEISESAVSEAARLLRSDTAILVLAGVGDAVGVTAVGSLASKFPTDSADPFWSHLESDDGAQLLNGDTRETLQALAGRSIPELITAPLDDETGPIGFIIVTGRSGAAHQFNQSDVSRVQNLAEQLVPTLRKGLLHQQIEYEARHDALTGLPNRTAFELHLAEQTLADHGDRTLFVLMLDLDRFKEVNDTLGHHAGDDLLIEFSRRVSLSLNEGDMLARLAGDEFAIATSRKSHDDVFDMAQLCVKEASRAVTLDGLSIVVTASVGIAVVDPDDRGAMAPMRRADIAMYNAKSHHMGIDTYRDEIDRRTPTRLSMLGDLREAIEKEHLSVEFQPKLDLTTGLVTGAEALVRWTHAVRGVVPPSDFVRVAEDTGLIKQLTDLMLGQGISALRSFHERGHHLGLSVNLSTHDLLDARLPERVRGHLEANGVDPSALTLEITESSLLVEAPRSRATIDELHAIGVRLSIDDFGTGYSSLSYLRQLPVRELKIDQSFVANVLLDEQDEVIVRSTIDLGHNLGLEVVAEGVENNEVLDRLRWFGCDVAQGYCISRPLTASKFIAWLNTTAHPSRRQNPFQFEELFADTDAPVDSANDVPVAELPVADVGATDTVDDS